MYKMDSFITNSNNDIKRLNYRLGDSIRINNVGNLPKDCFAHKYYSNSKIKDKLKPQVRKTVPIDYEILYDIVADSQYKECPKKSILFHLRLYDWITWRNSGKLTLEDYESFIDKHKDLLQNVDNVLLLYGGCNKNKSNSNKTDEFINSLTNKLKKYNSNVFNINTINVDQDFKYIVTSDYYVPSLGGFSNLGGAINKNTVYWDLSEKLFNAYKAPQDKKAIENYKKYYMNNI